jgi:hypothetical protein
LISWDAEIAHIFKVPYDAQKQARRFVENLRMYELPASDTLSIIGDPLLRDDPAYLGHMANDAASCSQ